LADDHERRVLLAYLEDRFGIPETLFKEYHIVLPKEAGRPKGRAHINGIEGFWSYAKHWLYS